MQMLKSGNIIDTENSRSRNNVFENVKLNTLYIVFCFSTQETDIVEVVDTVISNMYCSTLEVDYKRYKIAREVKWIRKKFLRIVTHL